MCKLLEKIIVKRVNKEIIFTEAKTGDRAGKQKNSEPIIIS